MRCTMRVSFVTLATVMVGLAGGSAGALGKEAAGEKLQELRGGVVAIEGDRITLGVNENGKKGTKELVLPPEAVITLQADRKGERNPGKKEDVEVGCAVVVRVAADGKTVVEAEVSGRTVHGTIAGVEDKAVTIAMKGKAGVEKATYTVTEQTQVVLSTGAKKGEAEHGKATDLKEGMSVTLRLSAVDKSVVKEIGVSAAGEKKGK